MIYSPLIDPTSDSPYSLLARSKRIRPTCSSNASNLQKTAQRNKGPGCRKRLCLGCGAVNATVSYYYQLAASALQIPGLAAPTSHGRLSRHRVMLVGPGSTASSTAPITGRRPHGTASTKISTTPLFVLQRQLVAYTSTAVRKPAGGIKSPSL